MTLTLRRPGRSFASLALASAVALGTLGLTGCESGRGGDSPAASRSGDDGGTDVNRIDNYPSSTGTTRPMNSSMNDGSMNDRSMNDRSMSNRNRTPSQGRTRTTQSGVETTLAYPTGNEQTSVLMLKSETPASVRVGESFEYIISVTNLLDDTAVHGVRVMNLGNGTTNTTNPAAMGGVDKAENGTVLLELGTLAPGQTVTRRVPTTITNIPAGGQVANCLSLEYAPTMCVVVNVVNPEIKLVKSGPASVSICEPITYTYAVTNTGNGTARNVTVMDDLASGLTTADGSRSVQQNVGDVAPGETKRATVTVQPAKPGTYASAASAKSASSTVNSDPVSTQVKNEELSLAIQAPETEYAGQTVNYTALVKNTGDVAVQNVKVNFSVAGTNQRQQQNIPSIGVGETVPVPVKVSSGNVAGNQTLNVAVQSPCPAVRGPAAAATVAIKSISALQIEVVDKADPVRIGDNVVYTITVLNQGSAEERDVSLTAELPEQESFVSGNGSSTVSADGKNLTLGAVNIAPKQTANWTVTVKADGPGDVRFNVNLKAPSLTKPVLEQEPTKLYDPNAGGQQTVEGKPQEEPVMGTTQPMDDMNK